MTTEHCRVPNVSGKACIARRKIKPHEEKEVVRLYKTGMSTVDLGNQYGVSPTAILNVLHRNKTKMRSGADWKYSERVRQDIIRRYCNYETIQSIANHHQCSLWFIKNIIKTYNIPCRGAKPRYPDLKHDFFSVIDSPEKAWMLGFIATDGCVSKRSLSIVLKRDDRYILELIADLICPSAIVKNGMSSSKKFKRVPTSRLQLYSQQICKDLLLYGIHPNKTRTVQFWHAAPGNLIHHYIRGIFDGDGCYHTAKTNNMVSLSSASKMFLMGVAKTIEKHTGISPSYFKKRKNKDVWEIKYWKNNKVRDIAKWIYQEDSIGLVRKQEIAHRFINTVTREYFNWENTTLEQLLENRKKYKDWREMSVSMGVGLHQLKNRINRLRRLARGIKC